MIDPEQLSPHRELYAERCRFVVNIFDAHEKSSTWLIVSEHLCPRAKLAVTPLIGGYSIRQRLTGDARA